MHVIRGASGAGVQPFSVAVDSAVLDDLRARIRRTRLGPDDIAQVPTAVAVFPHTFVPEGEPPREWAERLYDIHRWTVMPAGGHFAPAEEPELVARDIAAFFATVDR